MNQSKQKKKQKKKTEWNICPKQMSINKNLLGPYRI